MGSFSWLEIYDVLAETVVGGTRLQIVLGWMLLTPHPYESDEEVSERPTLSHVSSILPGVYLVSTGNLCGISTSSLDLSLPPTLRAAGTRNEGARLAKRPGTRHRDPFDAATKI